jgi:hypothetical protein
MEGLAVWGFVELYHVWWMVSLIFMRVHVGLISVCWAAWLYLQFLSLQKAPLLHAQLIWMLASSHSTIFIGAIMTVFRVESP